VLFHAEARENRPISGREKGRGRNPPMQKRREDGVRTCKGRISNLCPQGEGVLLRPARKAAVTRGKKGLTIIPRGRKGGGGGKRLFARRLGRGRSK